MVTLSWTYHRRFPLCRFSVDDGSIKTSELGKHTAEAKEVEKFIGPSSGALVTNFLHASHEEELSVGAIHAF